MEAIDLYNEETAKMKEQGGGREQVNILFLRRFTALQTDRTLGEKESYSNNFQRYYYFFSI